jgi:hypothetical protein
VDLGRTLSVQSLCTTYTSNPYSLSLLRHSGEPVEAMSWRKVLHSFPSFALLPAGHLPVYELTLVSFSESVVVPSGVEFMAAIMLSVLRRLVLAG